MEKNVYGKHAQDCGISVSQEPPRSPSKINRHTLMTILTLFSTPLIHSFNLQFGNKFLPTTIWIHSPNLGPLKPPETLKPSGCLSTAKIACRSRYHRCPPCCAAKAGGSWRTPTWVAPLRAESSHFDDVFF